MRALDAERACRNPRTRMTLPAAPGMLKEAGMIAEGSPT